MGGFWHLDGCSGSGIGVGCRFGRFTWAGAGCFGAFWALRKGLGEGLLVPLGDPNSVFRSFSWVADGTDRFLVRLGIALDPWGVSIKHLVAPGAPKTGRVHSRQKLKATQGRKGV